MAVLTSAGITFGDATTQTTAATAPTTANVLNATAGASLGAVGTYAFLGMASTTTISAGTTYAGSGLRYAGVSIMSGGGTNWTSNQSQLSIFIRTPNGGGTPAGTWRAMGYNTGGADAADPPQQYAPATMFLRIS